MDNQNEEEDEVPSLIDVDPNIEEIEASPRVPLTIVTGISPTKKTFCWLLADAIPWIRIPRRRQDHACELHSQRTARQKNRRHSQRLVHHQICDAASS